MTTDVRRLERRLHAVFVVAAVLNIIAALLALTVLKLMRIAFTMRPRCSVPLCLYPQAESFGQSRPRVESDSVYDLAALHSQITCEGKIAGRQRNCQKNRQSISI
jgi:hypothetical protein